VDRIRRTRNSELARMKIETGGERAALKSSGRAATIKLKINGRCVNRCRFCQFHDDRVHQLQTSDLGRLFDLIERPRFYRIVISGGNRHSTRGFWRSARI